MARPTSSSDLTLTLNPPTAAASGLAPEALTGGPSSGLEAEYIGRHQAPKSPSVSTTAAPVPGLAASATS
jgi:hypothetical protein